MIADLASMLAADGHVQLDLHTVEAAGQAIPVLRAGLRAVGVEAHFAHSAQFVYVDAA